MMVLLFVFVTGICIGSFLNVVGLRIPAGQSIVYPGSACPTCSHVLKPYELVPIISYLFLKGKCRICKEPISAKYPIMELLTGISYVFLYIQADSMQEFIFHLILVSVLIALTVADLEFRLVPNKILLYSFIVLLPLGVYVSEESLLQHALGGAVFFIGLLLVAIVSKGGMGGGDIKLFTLLGFTLGLKATFLIFFLACFTGAVVGMAIKIKNRQVKVVPFVPFICIGVLVTLAYKEELWALLINR